MQTLILPGFSPGNKTWLDKCAESLRVDGIIRPVTWDHWLDSDQKFDAKEKGWLISRHSKGDQMNIIAKSIGTLVASFVAAGIPSQINKIILLGIPLNDFDLADRQQIIKGLSVIKPEKILCFQNEEDPHASFAAVRSFLPSSIKVNPMPASDHEYAYFEDFNEFLLKA